MTMYRWPARSGAVVGAAAALASLSLLGGCVAAAAIPVLAGGALATTGRADTEERSEGRAGRVAIPADQQPDPASGASAAAPIVRTQDFPDGSRVEVTVPGREQASASEPSLARTGEDDRAAVPPTDDWTDNSKVIAVMSGDLPPPFPPPGGAVAEPSASGDYAGFAAYAERQGSVPVAGAERKSAILADPLSLSPVTRDCSIHPAAVLVDLDPAGATLDPLRATRADPALAASLADLRSRDIGIAWVSSVTADRAGAVRKALVNSGLDPAGRDDLVLLRFPEERKQTRRQDIAKELCIVAIAGDERADFDELFEYLKNPVGASTLEPLIGSGWFLIPTPLS